MTGGAFTAADTEHMRRALELAARGLGGTRPNPAVGCVLVRDRVVLGEGWHRRAGEPHAEVEALRACTADPRGATAYVTLEPCNHHGRTGPCTEALLAAGIARVVCAARDPNPQAQGGLERLAEAGVAVAHGLLATEARLLNPAFHTYHSQKRPLVTLKWAMTADGAISAESHDSKWITAEDARREAHRLRAAHDATLVGIETLLADNARLNVRDVALPAGPPLRRVVLDSHLRTPLDSAFLAEEQGIPTIVAAADATAAKRALFEKTRAEIIAVRRGPDGRLSLPGILEALRERGVQSVLVEGGRRVAGSFFDAGLADRAAIFIAPKLLASSGAYTGPLRAATPRSRIAEARDLHHTEWKPIGSTMLLSGWLTEHLFA